MHRSAPINIVKERWTECLNAPPRKLSNQTLNIGVLQGEGVGPEVIGAALEVLDAVAKQSGLPVKLSQGGCIGREAEQIFATPLSGEVIQFCEDVFAQGGAILHGPGGGRFVYDLRQRFDLFFKISPIRTVYGVAEASRLKPDALRGVDILVTRENSGGIYQGSWDPDENTPGGRLARHHFSYHEHQVRRFLEASARLAKQRRGTMAVVVKESGIPSLSSLWRSCAEQAAAAHGVRFTMVDVDLMAYRLVHEASKFDVVASPNLFGDVLADLGAALLGSRGASFSGNYGPTGHAVYQTNHGAAFDIAGTDRANPAGQIFALAMMLRESFGLDQEAASIEDAVRSVWSEGWRTEDVAGPAAHIVGTSEMGGLVAERAVAILDARIRQPAKSPEAEEAAQPGTSVG